MPVTKSNAKGKAKAKPAKPAPKPSRKDWPKEGWATLDDAAEFFGVSRRTVERLIKGEKLRKSKLSRNVSRVDWSDIWKYKGAGNG